MRILALAVLAVLISLLVIRFLAATRTAPDSGKLTPEQLREDFAILRGALEEAHPGIYRYTPKA